MRPRLFTPLLVVALTAGCTMPVQNLSNDQRRMLGSRTIPAGSYRVEQHNWLYGRRCIAENMLMGSGGRILAASRDTIPYPTGCLFDYRTATSTASDSVLVEYTFDEQTATAAHGAPVDPDRFGYLVVFDVDSTGAAAVSRRGCGVG